MDILVLKNSLLIKKLGLHIQEQRIKVFHNNYEQLCEKMSSFTDHPIAPHDIKQLESGDGSIPIAIWMAAWQLMQVGEKIVDSSKVDTALFLASAAKLNLSEADILLKTPKK